MAVLRNQLVISRIVHCSVKASKIISLIDNPKYVDLYRFIEVIRDNLVVWNSNLPEYHIRRVREESMARGAAAVDATAEAAEFCMVNQGRHCGHLSVSIVTFFKLMPNNHPLYL